MANKFEKIINSFQFDKPSKKQAALFLKAAKRQIVDLVKTKIKKIQKNCFLRENLVSKNTVLVCENIALIGFLVCYRKHQKSRMY